MKRSFSVLLLLCTLLFCACSGTQTQPKTSPSPDGQTVVETTAAPTEADAGFAFEDLTLQPQQSAPVLQTRGDKTTKFFFRAADASIAAVNSEERTVFALSPGQTSVDVWLEGTTQRVAVFTVTVEGVIPQPTETAATVSETPVSTTEPPAPTTEPPAPTTEPTVITTDTPVPTTETPVTTTEPPIVTTETPIPSTPTVTPSTVEEVVPIESFEVIGPTDVFVGTQYYLIIKTVPENANEHLNYSSSDGSVCPIDGNGVFCAASDGTVRFTVKTDDGRLSETVAVYIHNYVTDFSIKCPGEINVGETITIECTILPEGTPNKGLYWVNEKGSGNRFEGVLKISPDGLYCTVTGLKAGMGCITIGSNDFPDSIIKTIFIVVND